MKQVHDDDLYKGYGGVYLPFALQRKCLNANRCYTFRHSFATHLLESGYDIRTVQ